MSMRTRRTEAAYSRAKQDGSLRPLADEYHLREWKYWVLIDNRFPHDLHHTKNHLLVRKKTGSIYSLRLWEWAELLEIYHELKLEYDYLKLNFPSVISVPDYLHFHLMTLKDRYK